MVNIDMELLEAISEKIGNLQMGDDFCLRSLFGEKEWEDVASKNHLGKAFRALVTEGGVPNTLFDREAGNHTIWYRKTD